MMVADVANAFITIPVESRSQDLLRFRHEGRTWKFVCLPFGYPPPPRVEP